MTLEQAPFRIVVGIDFSALSLRALEHAFEGASARLTAEVHVVAVVEDLRSELIDAQDRRGSLVDATDHVRERLAAHGTDALLAFHARRPASRQFPVIAHLRVGPSAEQIIGLAGEIGADLIIVGTHGRRGVMRMVMGSVAERTVRLAPCAVLVVRPKNTHVLDGLPKIEPACSHCVAMRERTAGHEWWCEGHAVAPEPAHTFSHSRRLDEPPQPAFGR